MNVNAHFVRQVQAIGSNAVPVSGGNAGVRVRRPYGLLDGLLDGVNSLVMGSAGAG